MNSSSFRLQQVTLLQDHSLEGRQNTLRVQNPQIQNFKNGSPNRRTARITARFAGHEHLVSCLQSEMRKRERNDK